MAAAPSRTSGCSSQHVAPDSNMQCQLRITAVSKSWRFLELFSLHDWGVRWKTVVLVVMCLKGAGARTVAWVIYSDEFELALRRCLYWILFWSMRCYHWHGSKASIERSTWHVGSLVAGGFVPDSFFRKDPRRRRGILW
jgi:hypothetical protein